MVDDDSTAIGDHAKWLIDRHLRRYENIATHCAALLGFTGVTLALLLQAVNGAPIHPTPWIWASLTATTSLLLATACCCIQGLRTNEVVVPAAKQLRRWWRDHAKNPRPDTAAPNVVETLVNSTNLNADSPIDSTKKVADRRATWFNRATWTLLAALAALTTLVLESLAQAPGR